MTNNQILSKITFKISSIRFRDIGGVGDPLPGQPGYQTHSKGILAPATLELFFTSILGALTTIGGIAFFLFFIFGAYNWITSHGEPEKIAKAQRYITNALIGLILIVGTWAIVGIIGLILGFNILDLADNIENIFVL